MQPEDRVKTAFMTHQGLYEGLVMPFELSNATAMFQALLNSMFSPFLRKFVLIFLTTYWFTTPLGNNVYNMWNLCSTPWKTHRLFAKETKCSFGKTQVEYLGHVILEQGVAMDLTKVSAVKQWPVPKDMKQLRGFLGLSRYYRRFVRRYAHIASPLTKLIHKDGFRWTEEAQGAYESLKQALTQAPILALPDFSKLFVVETYTFGCGIGAVLSQTGHPVAYFSKQISTRM